MNTYIQNIKNYIDAGFSYTLATQEASYFPRPSNGAFPETQSVQYLPHSIKVDPASQKSILESC